jgi:hypothetical protein
MGRWAEFAEVAEALEAGEDPSVPVTGIVKEEGTISLGWAPMIPGFGITRVATDHSWGGTTDVKRLDPVNPLGAYLRASTIPYRWGSNKLGFEWNIYVLETPNRWEWIDDRFYRYLDLLSAVQFNILYQRVLSDPWQLSVRAGLGISNPYDNEDDDNESVEIPPAVNAGVSFQYFFWKGFYAEAGLDYTISLGRRFHHIIRPGIGIGWQFNRNAETGFKK